MFVFFYTIFSCFMKIIKVINNNTVCALDKKGKEQIISGKGIGFGKKPVEEIDSAQIQKIYMFSYFFLF